MRVHFVPLPTPSHPKLRFVHIHKKSMASHWFAVKLDADAVAQERLDKWASGKFARSVLLRDADGSLNMSCENANEAKTAKSFKLSLRNFAQNSGTSVGAIHELRLLTREEFDSGTTPTRDAQTAARKAAIYRAPPEGEATEIVSCLPSEFGELARQRYEELISIRAF